MYYLYNTPDMNITLYLVSRGYGSDEIKVKLLFRGCGYDRLDIVKELVEQHKVDPNSELDQCIHAR